MQAVGPAQATAPAQKHALNSAHRLPRSGGTLVHDWLAACQVSASATVPPAESSDELPVVRQNAPVQEMAFSWAGFPLAGSSKSRDQDVPFHWAVTAFWIGSCDCVQVPTAMHLVALAQDKLASPQGPGALPVQKSVCGFHRCQVVPFHDRTRPLKMTMQSLRLPHETPATPPAGLGIVCQDLPFQRSAPVGPPAAMQNHGAEQDTLVSEFPGGFFSVRQVEPFQVIACECRT